MTTAESLRLAFTSGLDGRARVRVRRPASLFQIDLPAFMGDGDGVAIYVRPAKGDTLVVTDLGSTRTRLSYQRKVTAELDEELGRLAEHQGLVFEDGEIRAVVPTGELLAASLGLLQVEAQAEGLAVGSRRRAREASEFREKVLALLHEVFGNAMQEPFYDKATDPEALFKVDVLVAAPKPLAIAVVPGDLDAERAVSAKLALQATVAPAKTRWIAIPRDMERLTSGRARGSTGSTSRRDRRSKKTARSSRIACATWPKSRDHVTPMTPPGRDWNEENLSELPAVEHLERLGQGATF